MKRYTVLWGLAAVGVIGYGSNWVWAGDPIVERITEFRKIVAMSATASTESVETFCSDLKVLCDSHPDLPSAVSGYWMLGMAAAATRAQEGSKYFNAAVATYERIPRDQITTATELAAGYCYQRLGRQKEAIGILTRIAKDDSDFADAANQRLVRLYEEAGDSTRAKGCFERIKIPNVRLALTKEFPGLGEIQKIQEEVRNEQAKYVTRMAAWVFPPVPDSATSTPQETILKATQAVRLIRVATDLVERFRLRYGRYPASLPEAAGGAQWLICYDPFQPGTFLRYELTEDHVFVWSVGPDGKDDHHSLEWRPGQAKGDIIASRKRD